MSGRPGEMEDHERDAMIDSIRCRREEFDPPLAENPPPGAKWKAKQGLNSAQLEWRRARRHGMPR